MKNLSYPTEVANRLTTELLFTDSVFSRTASIFLIYPFCRILLKNNLFLISYTIHILYSYTIYYFSIAMLSILFIYYLLLLYFIYYLYTIFIILSITSLLLYYLYYSYTIYHYYILYIIYDYYIHILSITYFICHIYYLLLYSVSLSFHS